MNTDLVKIRVDDNLARKKDASRASGGHDSGDHQGMKVAAHFLSGGSTNFVAAAVTSRHSGATCRLPGVHRRVESRDVCLCRRDADVATFVYPHARRSSTTILQTRGDLDTVTALRRRSTRHRTARLARDTVGSTCQGQLKKLKDAGVRIAMGTKGAGRDAFRLFRNSAEHMVTPDSRRSRQS